MLGCKNIPEVEETKNKLRWAVFANLFIRSVTRKVTLATLKYHMILYTIISVVFKDSVKSHFRPCGLRGMIATFNVL